MPRVAGRGEIAVIVEVVDPFDMTGELRLARGASAVRHGVKRLDE